MPKHTIIYTAAYPEKISGEQFDAALGLVPDLIRQKVLRYRRWEDAYGCLFGKLLLMRALREQGHAGDLHDLLYSSFGKPYLDRGPDLNISHSGNRVVCILGGEKSGDAHAGSGAREGAHDWAGAGIGVGIDLEEIKEMAIGDFRDQFTAFEWEEIQQAAEPLPVFYRYWTAKESVAKADGRGLNIPLSEILIENNTAILLKDRHWHIHRVPFFQDYACHVAATEKIAVLEEKEIPLTNLIMSFFI